MKGLIATTLIFFTIFLTACWDLEDINNKILVLSAGIDKLDNGNIKIIGEGIESNNLNIKSQNSESRKKGLVILSGEGNNIENARSEINNSFSYNIYLGTSRVIVFGRNYAEEGILLYLNRIEKTNDYRKTVIPIVCNNNITDLYNVEIKNEAGLGFYLENNIKKMKEIGQYYYPTVTEILNKQQQGLGYILPCITIEDNKLIINGFAVFNEKSKMIGSITRKQNAELSGMLFLLVKNATNKIYLNTKDEEELVFNIVLKKKKITAKYKDGNKYLNIELKVDANYEYKQGNASVDMKSNKELTEKIKNKVKESIMSTIDYSQQLNCDYLGLLEYFRIDYPNQYEKEKFNEDYNSVIPSVQVDVKIKNTTSMEDLKK